MADGMAMPQPGLSVVHVVRQFAPSVGGLEDCVLNLARMQRDHQGVDATVITLNRIFTDRARHLPAAGNVQGIPVRRLRWAGSTRYPVAPSVLAAIRDADIVHVHGIDFFFDFLAATRAVHGKRLVASTHGGFFHTGFASGLKKVWFDRITRLSLRAYDAIVACSDNDARLFGELGPANLLTIENGVDVGKFVSGPGAGRHAKRILTFGRFAAHKRIPALFRLLALLRAQDPAWELVVAGSAADQTEADLARAVAEHGVTAGVRLCLAPSDATLAQEISAATWFACASAHEGFGIAAVEAASGGLIPVLSDIAPFAKLVRRLGEGVLFDAEDPSPAAATLIQAVQQPERLAAQRDKVAGAAMAYGWGPSADAYLRLYRSIVQRTPVLETA